MIAAGRARPAGMVKPPDRMRFFATLWSLRGYPSARREWSWPHKWREIRTAGFSGVMSPPLPALAGRGELEYLAITSIDRREKIAPVIAAIRDLRPVGLVVQLGRVETPLAQCLQLARSILTAAESLAVPVEFETHRNTFLETPEKVFALARAWQDRHGTPLPLCYDFAHLAVVRHLRAPYWPAFAGQHEAIARARCLHLRPFNGHHCQIPVSAPGGRRAPEYRPWLDFVRDLFGFLRTQGPADRIIVPEIGHAEPAYRLSCFPDTWTDTRIAHRDLRRVWRRSAAGGR